MKIQDIYQLCNEPLKKENLISIFDIDDKKRNTFKIPDNKKIQEIFDKFNLNTNNVFLNTKDYMNPVCYYKDTVYVPINMLEEDFIRDFHIADRIKLQTEEHQKWIKDKSFDSLFSFADKKIFFIIYKEYFDQIPDNEKFNWFIYIYTTSEYGFSEFLDLEFIKEIIKYKKDDRKELIRELKPINEYITIYRGEGSRSASIDKAYSWSVDINKALFFANRFNQSENSRLYEAKIHIDNIIAYIKNRGEEEVLVFPDKLEDVKIIEMFNFEDIIDDEMIDIYHYYIEKLRPKYFYNPDNIHGILHAKRVLLLCLLFGKLYNLNTIEKEILEKASIYHDIGRISEGVDDNHGKLSFEKIKKLKLIDKNYKDIETLRYIITEHCISDEIAFENIKKYNIKNKKRAIKLLKIFKDADGLDRVRLGDLDVRYLRTDYSIKLSGIAKQLLAGIK